MSRKVMSLLAATALSALLLSCGKEEVSVEYVHTSYEKSDFPETISFNGGTFKFSFKADTVKLTKASEPIFLAWKYRVNVGEATGEPVEITSKTDAVEISVPANYTENSRTITVEAAFTPAPENYDDEPSTDVVWKEVASATQDAALVLIEDFYWAKGNITLKDGKFAIAENMSDAGLYFKKVAVMVSAQSRTPMTVWLTLRPASRLILQRFRRMIRPKILARKSIRGSGFLPTRRLITFTIKRILTKSTH